MNLTPEEEREFDEKFEFLIGWTEERFSEKDFKEIKSFISNLAQKRELKTEQKTIKKVTEWWEADRTKLIEEVEGMKEKVGNMPDAKIYIQALSDVLKKLKE